jgi:hypothetical protein
MKPMTLIALVFAACQGGSPSKPAKDLDPNDPRSVVEHAAFNTRTQRSYETKFKARLSPPQGDALDYTGQCVWVAPGVLYIHYTASGGDEKNIVRVGNRVWIHHPLVGWATSDEAAMPGAGRGIQNPDEVLAVLAKHAGGAKLRQPGVVDLAFSGDDIEKIMKEQAQQGAFEWKQSNATVELHADADNRLKKFVCQATLKPADPNVKGVVKYSAEVEAAGYNGATELKFLDEAKKEIKPSNDIKKAIDTLLKEKK